MIWRLSDKSNSAPIPYRDSKLTRLLKYSLEGRSKIVIISTISPNSHSFTESISTLKFAQRAKKVSNVVKRNEVIESSMELEKYVEEIRRLQLKLEESEAMMKVYESERTMEVEQERDLLDKTLQKLFKEKTKVEEELRQLKGYIINSESVTKELTDESHFLSSFKNALREKYNPVLRLIMSEGSVVNTPPINKNTELSMPAPMERGESLLIDIEGLNNILAAEDPLALVSGPVKSSGDDWGRDEMQGRLREKEETINQLWVELEVRAEKIRIMDDELRRYKEKFGELS